MTTRRTTALLATCAVPLTSAILPPPARAATCDFADYTANLFLDGPCTMDAAAATQTFVVRGQRVRVAFGEHQGRFHRWRLNGKAASAYEFNREAYCGWTDDLAQSFCFAYRGPIPQ